MWGGQLWTISGIGIWILLCLFQQLWAGTVNLGQAPIRVDEISFLEADLSHDLGNRGTMRRINWESASDIRHATCVPGPYIDCDAQSNRNVIEIEGSYNSTLTIGLINIPHWLGRELSTASACSHQLCTFQEGTVTHKTDVVAVHAKLLKEESLPSERWMQQLYVLLNWEPPYKFESLVTTGRSMWEDQFNLTMSYRLDSDIFYPSYKLQFDPRPVKQRPDYGSIFRQKTKTAVWFVSNCYTLSDRESYVREMQKYVDVDIYGECGLPAPCRFDMDNQPCLFEILKDYKFYLSFENSFCKDYVTEKAFKIYNSNTYVVPVLRGALDYDKYFPSNTFINTAHFYSARELALHLKHLASDVDAYTQYLAYKDMYKLVILGNRFCQLCLALHSLTVVPGTYSMHKWIWQGCYYPPDLPGYERIVLWIFLLLASSVVLWCLCFRYLPRWQRCLAM